MRLEFAPLEGITSRSFRELHAAFFPGVDRYGIPFLSPTEVHQLTPKQRRELEPGSLGCSRLLPQLLTKSPEDFVWAAGEIGELGYTEVNLNLGCPSGTVVSKGKGAGLLREPDALDRFLEEIFRRSPLPVSVKTRLGLEDPAEWEILLRILARYPIKTLTVHPRTRRELYGGQVHPEAFCRARQVLNCPLCFNGNLFTAEAVRTAKTAWPELEGLMLGRGLLADPALVTRCKGGTRSREALLGFHNALAQRYLRDMHPDGAALPKFKELWAYLILLFPEDGSWKRLRKARRWTEFYPLTQELLQNRPMLEEADLSRLGQYPVDLRGCPGTQSV